MFMQTRLVACNYDKNLVGCYKTENRAIKLSVAYPVNAVKYAQCCVIYGCGDILKTRDISRYNITRYYTQHNTFEGKKAVMLKIHERRLSIALTGELWVSFVTYFDISRAHCAALQVKWCGMFSIPCQVSPLTLGQSNDNPVLLK